MSASDNNTSGKANTRKVTILDIHHMKQVGQPITMMTAYDYPSSLLVDQAGIDMILVGDSLAMVELGMESTLPITMDEMLHHCRAVKRGSKRAFLVGDMPFMSYQAEISKAIDNAGRFLKEAGMEAVKLEGGSEIGQTITAIVNAGIPVMGHIGLTPQSISKLGGYRVQGKTAESARRLLADAIALEEAGCFSIVLEAMPSPIAKVITQKIGIPTIGIGAGPDCDGQVLVYHDLMGLFERFTPKFVKQYANLNHEARRALESFRSDVLEGTFPAQEHEYGMDKDELDSFLSSL